MKIKFKVQPYQTAAVEAVVDCFAGQPYQDALGYLIDPGLLKKAKKESVQQVLNYGVPTESLNENSDFQGFRNGEIRLTPEQLLENIQRVQRKQNLFPSVSLTDYKDVKKAKPVSKSYHPGAKLNLDIEMETGTGKTYCYIKTIFELNKRYGWNKFIIMVPSIAIREGVQKSLQMTAEHFAEQYHKKARFFTYNSKRLHEIESFSSDGGINIMVMNIQAFNARGADNRRIYDELDDFQSRRPIDVIKQNKPILILDEPQKMEGKATLDALPEFNPLFILRYSATHSTQHNVVHRLDAVDAYNQKLVKKIAVRGIQTRGLAGTSAYLYLESIEISKHAPVARIDMQVQLQSGVIKQQVKTVRHGDNLFELSNQLNAYQDRYVVSQIDAVTGEVHFVNGEILTVGNAIGDVTEEQLRRIQIRETVLAHLEKEKVLFNRGIKTLSLFFIDEVAKYRDYSREDEKGEYARIFEEEYNVAVGEYLNTLEFEGEADYRQYLKGITAGKTHNGYFSIDKRRNQLTDPKVNRDGDSDDVDAYDLIMKDKERLLSFEEPTRFIFSHSALREGWDNPNVFVLCMLKHSDNTISRRQEVGRGLRIAVDKRGERVDQPDLVHQINVLTVVANESYSQFVDGLQKEMVADLAARPRQASESFFTNKVLETGEGQVVVTADMARQIHRYLVRHDYVDHNDQITDTYYAAKDAGALAVLPEALQPYAPEVIELINSVFTEYTLPTPQNDRTPKRNPLNNNFHKKEFQELWRRINKKAIYSVDFDSEELVRACVATLDSQLNVMQLQYTLQTGEQHAQINSEQLGLGISFKLKESVTELSDFTYSTVKYDLVGKIAENTELTRQTAARILSKINQDTFHKFRLNPEHFISEASRLIKEQKATMVIERLSYDMTTESYDIDIFTDAQVGQDFSKATAKLNKHVQDYVIADSGVERVFADELETRPEVVVYAKLPRGFLIPTPVGDYNPDWAISFTEGEVKHIYFVAETKGSLSSMGLRKLEEMKIECARAFFSKLAQSQAENKVKYDVVDSYDRLLDLVR